MSNGRGKHKSRGKRRDKKTSKGTGVGARSTTLTEGEKVRLGHGILDSIKHVACENNWRGVGVLRSPFNAAQAAINEQLYPHLFRDDRR